MAIKYISKSQRNNKWKVSATREGKSIKSFSTQREAIAYAKTLNSTEALQIKRTSRISSATYWDQKIIYLKNGKSFIIPERAIPERENIKYVNTISKNTNSQKTNTKKPSTNKSTPKKVLIEKITQVNKPISKENKIVEKTFIKEKNKNKNNNQWSGIIGFISGISIIFIFVSLAFLIGFLI